MMGLDELVPPTRRVTVGGREIEVSPLRMRQVPGFAKAIAKPWTAIVMGEYLAAIMEWPREVTEAVSIATGAETEFLDNLRPDEFLVLSSAVLEVNLDFFARAVFPQATALGTTMQEVVAKMQPQPSALQPSLSAMGTATTTSLATRSPN
jgi:hypothetical protein